MLAPPYIARTISATIPASARRFVICRQHSWRGAREHFQIDSATSAAHWMPTPRRRTRANTHTPAHTIVYTLECLYALSGITQQHIYIDWGSICASQANTLAAKMLGVSSFGKHNFEFISARPSRVWVVCVCG